MTAWATLSRIGTPVLVAAAAALFFAALGASATDIGPWYQGLRQPSWKPPDLLFGPVWTVIYILTAWSGILVWQHGRDRAHRLRLMGLFALNALLNVLWSELFFKLQRPDWAVIELVPFWLSIVVLMVAVAQVSHTGAWLLTPYLAWVTFAGVLNLSVVQLNAPFRG